MLESTPRALSGLDRGLAELAAFGLVRAANVLLAEYLRALIAEEVLDTATAELIALAYNRQRYAATDADDPEAREAVAALDRVAERLAAMNPHDRQQLGTRIRQRIGSTAPPLVIEGDTEHSSALLETPVPTSRMNRARINRDSRSNVENALCSREPSDPTDSRASSEPAAKRLRPSLRRVPIELSAVAVLATFFGGYFFRESINKISTVGNQLASSGDAEQLPARDAWKNSQLWLDGIRFRADEEARAKRNDKARLALELVLAYSPNNVSLLNDLASLYLLGDESAPANPKRALELTEKALERTRQPAVLDTAAEAQFRCGNAQQAIRLESESLAKAFELGEDNRDFRTQRENQLKKFQGAAEIHMAKQTPAPAVEPDAPAIEHGNGAILTGLARARLRDPEGT